MSRIIFNGLIDPVGGIAFYGAASGLHINAGPVNPGFVYMGGPLLENTDIALSTRNLTVTATALDNIVISPLGGMTITINDENLVNTAVSVIGRAEFELTGMNVQNRMEGAYSSAQNIASVTEGGNAGPSVAITAYPATHPTWPRSATLNGGGNATGLRIQMLGNVQARNKIMFEINPASLTSAMTLDSVGCLLIGRATGFGSTPAVFKVQVGDGVADTRGLFIGNRTYVLGVQNGTGAGDSNRPFYFGASSGASPDGVFSGASGTELLRILNAGGVSTNGGGVRWQFGNLTTAAAVFDTTRYVVLQINGATYKLALCTG